MKSFGSGVVVASACGRRPTRFANCAWLHASSGSSQCAGSSPQKKPKFPPRIRAGSSAVKSVARAPLAKVKRCYDGTYIPGTNSPAASHAAIRPDGPSIMTFRTAGPVGPISASSGIFFEM